MHTAKRTFRRKKISERILYLKTMRATIRFRNYNIVFFYLSQCLTNLINKICFTISFISCLYMKQILCIKLVKY